MGRVKIEIKKIENSANRKVTYSKRRNGLMKKAYELSVLCDVDVAVITFSPSGELTHFCNNDRIEEVITRYANAPQPERTKRKLENVEYLDKAVKKLTDERGLEAPKVSYDDLQLEAQKLTSQVDTAMFESNFLEQERGQLGLDVIQNTLEQTSFEMNPSGADVQGSSSDVIQNTREQTSFEMNPSGADSQGSTLDVIENAFKQFLFEMNSSAPKVSYEDLQLEAQKLTSQVDTAMFESNFLEQERGQLGLDVIQNTLEQTSFEMNPSGSDVQGSSSDVIQNTREQTSFEMNPSGADSQGSTSDVIENAFKQFLFEMNSSAPKVSYEDLQLEAQKLTSQVDTAMFESNFLEQERGQLGLDVIQNTLEQTSFEMNPSGADVQGSSSDVIQNTREQTSFEMNPSGADSQLSTSDVIENAFMQFLFEMNSSGAEFQGIRPSLYTDLEPLVFDSLDVRADPSGGNV